MVKSIKGMDSEKAISPIYKEEQTFSKTIFIVPIFLLTLFATYILGSGMYKQLYHGIPFGNRPMSNQTLTIVIPLIIALLWGLTWMFYNMGVIAEVYENYLIVRFRPLVKKVIPYTDIQKCEAVTYRPILEFGGWGIRYRKGEVAYTVSGNQGVRLHLKNGKKILIGSLNPERLAQEINNRLAGISS